MWRDRFLIEKYVHDEYFSVNLKRNKKKLNRTYLMKLKTDGK